MQKTPYKLLKFQNGLNLILKSMPSVNSAVVYVAVGAGPRYETKETAGLAHFLEHMLFEGTKNLPSSKKVAEYIEKVGGRSSAWTDKEYVTYYAKVPKQYLGKAFSYLSDIFFNSLLDEKAIEKEKGIVMEELRRSKDNPEINIWDLWFEWVWGKDQSMGRSTLGDAVTIRNITKKKLQDYMTRFYHPSNMAIAVAGNFSIEEAEKYALKYFGKGRNEQVLSNRNKDIPQFEKQKFVPKKIHTQIIEANTHQSQLVLGFITDISYNHKDRFAVRLISDVLSGGVSSRLFHKLVYDLGIAYSAGAQSWIFSDGGLFYAYGGFLPENTKTAIKVIIEELERLKKEKISTEELNEAKEKDKAGLYFSLETPDAVASLYSSQQITEKQIMTPEEISKRIDEVTAEDIQRVARKYFIPKNLSLTIKGALDKEEVIQIENLMLSKLSH